MNNCYNIDELGLGNCHIHTNYSTCSQPEMSVAAIIHTAEVNQLETIALTDHHHMDNRDIIGNISSINDEIARIQPRIKVLVGAELSAYGINKYSESLEINRQLGFRLYACNHYHLDFWEHPADKSPRSYAEHNLAVTQALIESNRADCIAHPFVQSYLRDKFADITVITRMIKDIELEHLFNLGIKHNVAWEINEKLVDLDPEFICRFWKIGRTAGVEFRLGTDAHTLAKINTCSLVKKLKSIL
jgi:histidinol phosphatase-like PHP family hydrolase